MVLLLIETGIALLKKVILGEHIHILAHACTHTAAGVKKITKFMEDIKHLRGQV